MSRVCRAREAPRSANGVDSAIASLERAVVSNGCLGVDISTRRCALSGAERDCARCETKAAGQAGRLVLRRDLWNRIKDGTRLARTHGHGKRRRPDSAGRSCSKQGRFLPGVPYSRPVVGARVIRPGYGDLSTAGEINSKSPTIAADRPNTPTMMMMLKNAAPRREEITTPTARHADPCVVLTGSILSDGCLGRLIPWNGQEQCGAGHRR